MNKRFLHVAFTFCAIIIVITACTREELYHGITKNAKIVPILTDFSPLTGKPETEITIIGEDFWAVTNVYLGNTEVSFEAKSATEISVIVPRDIPYQNSYFIRLDTDIGSLYSEKVFTLIPLELPEIESITPRAAASGETVTISGHHFSTVSGVAIGGERVSEVAIISDTEMTFVVNNGLQVGPSILEIANNDGTTLTNPTDFYVIAYITPDFNEDWEGPRNELNFTTGSDAENDPDKSGWSYDVMEYDLLPKPIDGLFYTLGGISNTADSGAYCGQIAMFQVEAGTFANFFMEGNDNLEKYYFNIQINFQGIPLYYPINEPLAGLRVRFDVPNIDVDGDGSTNDQYLSYRPTLEDLESRNYAPNPDGWYSISIPFSDFIYSGEVGASWNDYSIKDHLTRFAVASRRGHNGPFSMSLDNLLITKGGPAYFPNSEDFILSNKD